MPTYDFKCENDHIFEIYLKKIYDENHDIVYCPICFEIEKRPLKELNRCKRLFSKNKISWILVGEGWAKDGYGNKKEKN